MFTRKKSSPIVLVTPGDVVSAQHLLKVQQNSLSLFFSRSYYSYKFVGLYVVLFGLGAASGVWLVVERRTYPRTLYPASTEFVGLDALISLITLLEFTWRLALKPICDYVKEPIHWVDFAITVLWFAAFAVVASSSDEKYFLLVLSVQVLFVARTMVPCVMLVKRLRKSKRKDSNLNILNISHMPGEREEVEVIVLDDSSHNSQPTQHDHTQRQMVTPQAQAEVRVEKGGSYFSPKNEEAAMKLEAEEDN